MVVQKKSNITESVVKVMKSSSPGERSEDPTGLTDQNRSRMSKFLTLSVSLLVQGDSGF